MLRPPERSPAAERTLVHALRDQLNLVPGRRVDFDGHAASAFAEKLRAFQKRVIGAAERETFEDRVLRPRFTVEDDRFDVVFETDAEDGDGEPRRADPAAVLRAYHARLSLVPLLDGGWAPLPTDWLARFGRPLADLLAARQDDKRIPRAILPELGRFCDDIRAPRPAGLDRLPISRLRAPVSAQRLIRWMPPGRAAWRASNTGLQRLAKAQLPCRVAGLSRVRIPALR